MELSDLLEIRTGLTAIIGAGGKTSLMDTLARELQSRGRVLICTSTRIRRPEGLPVVEEPSGEVIAAALAKSPVVCVGRPAERGKLAQPGLPFETLCLLADYVLVEADGSRGLPAKAHAPWEPVIPATAGQVILVTGADCFGRPIGEICHRPERFAELAGRTVTDPVTPEALAEVIRSEGYGNRIYVNKTETPEDWAHARSLAALLQLPVTAGSLWRGEWECLY